MGEIKSTFELAMERTQKFTISEKEKKEIKQKEILQKATRLFHRYRDGHLPLQEIQKEIERMEKKTAAMVRESLLSQWIDALSLDDEDERTLTGIESFMQQNINEAKKQFHHLLFRYQQEREKVKEEVRIQLAGALKRKGIDGSAVELKIEGDERWKKENEKLDLSYKMKLEEIKEQLRGLWVGVEI